MHTYPSVYGAYAGSCILDQLDARALHFLDDLTYMRLVWKRLRKPTGNAVSPVLNASGTKYGNGIQPLEDKQKHHLFHLLVPFSVSYGNEIVSFVRWFYKLLSHVSLLFLVQYFQTENPLPPLAERGLHRAILPHQPGAPGDRTLLIGMCKVPSKCVLFHTFSTHQMCIKYIKSSRPTYKYVQDVSLDVSMHQGGPTSFRSFRIQLVGQSVSSQSKKITFRRCGKATGRGRTKRDLKTAAAVSGRGMGKERRLFGVGVLGFSV